MEKIQPLIDIFYNNKEAINFIVIFSRFEYALKRAGFASGNTNSISANWDRFYSRKEIKIFINTKIDSNISSYMYILKNPPKKQVLINNRIEWIDIKYNSQIDAINLSIRTVRNNLFHGGKYPLRPISDELRNIDLLSACNNVMLSLLDFDTSIRQYFYDL